MECNETWRVIEAWVRKVYDNVKNIVHIGRMPLDVEALSFSLPSI